MDDKLKSPLGTNRARREELTRDDAGLSSARKRRCDVSAEKVNGQIRSHASAQHHRLVRLFLIAVCYCCYS